MNMRCDTVRDLIPLCRDGIASAVVVGREAGSGTRGAFEELSGMQKLLQGIYKKHEEKRAARGYHRNDEESGRICRAVKKDPPPPSDLYGGRSHGRNRFPSRCVVHLRKNESKRRMTRFESEMMLRFSE